MVIRQGLQGSAPPFVSSTLLGVCGGGLELQDWKLEAGVQLLGLLGQLGVFCFVFICFVFAGIDYFFRLQFLVSGAPLCGHYPQGYECWGEVSPEHEGWLGGLSRKNLS